MVLKGEKALTQDIQWYPGHMTKARRMMTDSLKQIDVVAEVVDARAPFSTRNPDFDDLFSQKERVILLNKSDLADPALSPVWKQYYKEKGFMALSITATERSWWKQLKNAIERSAESKMAKAAQKGIQKTLRIMVAGIPNVGKSTLINSIAKNSRAQVGNKPGVTKGKQWVSVSPYMELLDTPGLLWPKLENQLSARHLAFIGSIRDGIADTETLATQLMQSLSKDYAELLHARYKKWAYDMSPEEMLEAVCKSRGFLLSGGIYDTERAAVTVLDEFRSGKIGRITLEKPDDFSSNGEEV